MAGKLFKKKLSVSCNISLILNISKHKIWKIYTETVFKAQKIKNIQFNIRLI